MCMFISNDATTSPELAKIHTMVVGRLQTNCYILQSDATAIIIDPGDEPERIVRFLNDMKVMPCSTSPSAEPIFQEETSRPSCIRSERGSSSWTMPPLSIRAMDLRLRLAMRSSQIHS